MPSGGGIHPIGFCFWPGMGVGITLVNKGTLQTEPACIGSAIRDPVDLDWLLETRERCVACRQVSSDQACTRPCARERSCRSPRACYSCRRNKSYTPSANPLPLANKPLGSRDRWRDRLYPARAPSGG